MLYLFALAIAFSLLNLYKSSLTSEIRLAITMICRDEDVNFKVNLEKWLPVVSYFVFLIDNRTTDGSVETISTILSSANKKYKIAYYNFNGFGSARTLSLQVAWDEFPFASHVLIADPDWAPDLKTINLSELTGNFDAFRFTAFDRNGFSKRRMDWLLRHRKGLAMRYSLHEVLSIGQYTVKNIDWVVHEIEKPGTWHTTVGHSNSMSAQRYEFDLNLLHKDLIEYGHDPHVHYYLGITHEAYYSKSMAEVGANQTAYRHHLDEAIKYLTIRATASHYDDEFVEQRWAAMFSLGTIYAGVTKVGSKHQLK